MKILTVMKELDNGISKVKVGDMKFTFKATSSLNSYD